MSRRTLIILIIIILILLASALYFFSSRQANPSTSSGGSFFGGFFSGGSNLPSAGNSTAADKNKTSGVTTTTPQLTQENKAKLVRISNEPVVGAAVRNREGRIRYFKKASGNLFENSFVGKDEKRISNVTIPAILDAVWSHSKDAVALSYYDGGELKRYYFQYTGTTTQSSGFLPNNIGSMAMASDAENMVYTIPASGGGYAIITALPNNTKQKTVLTTPISDFEVSWPASDLIALKTRTSAFAPGFLYTLNPSRGAATKLLGDIEGLDVLWGPGGKRFLYSKTSIEGHTLELFSYDLPTGAQQKLKVMTLSEKCLWSAKDLDVIFCAVPEELPHASLPDDWWQGKVSFNDVIVRINLKTGARHQLMAANNIDATHLLLSVDEQYLFFINKRDDSLWSLRVE